MQTRAIFVTCAAAAMLALPVSAQNNLSLPQVLSVAKMAGACGILDQLITFQRTTKLEGGDELVNRFWATEAARLGMTTKELSDHCDQAVAMYDQLMKATG